MGFKIKVETYKVGVYLDRCEIRTQLREQGCPDEHISELADEFYNKEYEIGFTVGKESLEDFKLIVS